MVVVPPRGVASSCRLLLAVLLLVLASGVHVRATPTSTRSSFRQATAQSHFVWKRMTDLPKPLSDFALAKAGAEYVYISGGCDTANDWYPNADANKSAYWCTRTSDQMYLYSRETDSYESITMPRKRTRHAMAFLNQYVWIFGGVNTNDIKDDPENESFFLVEELLAGPMDRYDTIAKTWRSEPDPVFGDIVDLVSWVSNGVIYASGGYNTSANYTDQPKTFRLDTNAFAWVEIPGAVMMQTRGDTNVYVSSRTGKAYLVGGWTSEDFWTDALSSVEVFDPVTETFSQSQVVDNLQIAGGDRAVCGLGARIFAFGGEQHVTLPAPLLGAASSPLDEVEVTSLDFQSSIYKDWHYAGELPSERFRFQCVSLDASSVTVFGGQSYLVGDLATRGSYFPCTARVDDFMEVRVYERVLNMRISGTANVGRLMALSGELLRERSRTTVRVSHRQIPSLQAGVEFLAANNEYASQDDMYVADAPLEEAAYTNLTNAQGHLVVHVPLVLTPVRFFFNLPDMGRDEMLVLDACSLAKILSGRQLTWGGATFLHRDNPFLARYGDLPIKVFRQVDASSMTVAVTTYLAKACTDGSSFKANDFVAQPVLPAPRKAPYVDVPGSFSYAYTTHLEPAKLYREAYMKNRNGRIVGFNTTLPGVTQAQVSEVAAWVTAPTWNTKADGYRGFTQFRGAFMDAAFDAAWPIVSMTYAYIRRDQTETAENGAFLKAFLAFLASDEGQALARRCMHFPLPQAWQTYAQRVLGSIEIASDALPFVYDSPAPEPDFAFSSLRRNALDYQVENLSAIVTNHDALLGQCYTTGSCFAPVANNNGQIYAIAVAALVIACVTFVLVVVLLVKQRKMELGHRLQQDSIRGSQWNFQAPPPIPPPGSSGSAQQDRDSRRRQSQQQQQHPQEVVVV